MDDDYQYLIYHFRIDRANGKLKRYHRGRTDWKPTERGGMTTCRIVDASGRVVGMGAAYCSMADNFVYRLGRLIAKGRAEKDMRTKALYQTGYELADMLGQVREAYESCLERVKNEENA
jgi:hypothetical protein